MPKVITTELSEKEITALEEKLVVAQEEAGKTYPGDDFSQAEKSYYVKQVESIKDQLIALKGENSDGLEEGEKPSPKIKS